MPKVTKPYFLGRYRLFRFISISKFDSFMNTFAMITSLSELQFTEDGLVFKALDFQSRGPVFKTTGWLQGRLSLSSFFGR